MLKLECIVSVFNWLIDNSAHNLIAVTGKLVQIHSSSNQSDLSFAVNFIVKNEKYFDQFS